VAQHTTRTNTIAQAVHIDNNDADNTDVTYVIIKTDLVIS